MSKVNNASPHILRAGLLGAGHISEFHIKALRRIPNVEIVGIADIDQTRAEAVAKAHAIPVAFSSLSELLTEKPDVIHVLTPPAAHANNAVESLQHGCHVMVEKPLADSLSGCEQIAKAVAASDKLLCIDHSLLYDPFIVKAMQIVRNGTIGQVVGVDHLRSQFYPHFSGGIVPETFRNGGFPFRDIGVHSLYLLEAFLGEIHDLTARLGTPETDGNPRFKEWRVLVECEQGLGHIYLSWNSNPLQNVVIIHGTHGVIRADLFGMSVTVRKSGRLPNHAERIANTMGEGSRMVGQVMVNVTRVLRKKLRQYHGLQDLVGEFYQAIAAGSKSPVDVQQGRNAVRWTERVATRADDAKRAYEARFAQLGTAETLVTGATGFIGRHLLKRLLQERDRVRILVRRTPGSEVFQSDRVETFLGDLGDSKSVDRAIAGIKEIFHLGATVEGEAEDFQCATIAGTRNIVDSCLKQGIEKLIYMSSLSVIDAASAASSGKPVQEDFPFEPHPERRGLYTQTKLDAERVVTEAVKSRGLRAVILRPGEVIGPDKLFLSGAVGREAAGHVVVLGGGKSIVPLIWVEDLVDAILAAAASDQFDGSVFNLVDPEEITQDELARHYLQALGRKPRLIHAPRFALYPTAFGLQLALRLLGKQSPITPYRLSSALGSRHFACSAAKQHLNWEARIGIRAGLATMLDPTLLPVV
jgi:predicted dehydrogenase/nucleoside-diphosphate-sugar epimerase